MKNFWSVWLRHANSLRAATSQPLPSKNNQRDDFSRNKDVSVGFCNFGPKPPKGKEEKSIETVPGKGWFAILRLYGPQEAWYDKNMETGRCGTVPE
ncbi:DUF1214 domain-containing protein [Vibrio lentus]|nr:DUF1214 domain-containing protein [Vibrio lentus]